MQKSTKDKLSRDERNLIEEGNIEACIDALLDLTPGEKLSLPSFEGDKAIDKLKNLRYNTERINLEYATKRYRNKIEVTRL